MKKIVFFTIVLLTVSCLPDSRDSYSQSYELNDTLEVVMQMGTEDWFENNTNLKYQYQKDFLNQIALPSYNEEKVTGLPMEVMMAQAILESGWGRSKLAKNHNNFFGIKEFRKGNKGAKLMTTEYKNGKKKKIKAKFRVYNTPQDCFKDRSEWFKSNYRYEDLDFDKLDYVDFSLELQKRGYATDPNYSLHLIKIIKKYQLDKYSNWLKKSV
jgi:flagellum-specific peptidoglycan hydrolase FlgJ